MTITPFVSKRGAISYLIDDQSSAVLIDPSAEECERIIVHLKQHQLTLGAILETHTHADFFSSVQILRALYPSAHSFRGAFEDYNAIHTAPHITAIATPGHTSDSHTFVCQDGERAHLFTGDTLLIGGTGRTDFQGGSSDDLYTSLTKLLAFNPDTIIHPGHNYQGNVDSTMAQELAGNQRLQLVHAGKRSEFVTMMNHHTPPKPDLFEESLSYNTPLYSQ